MNATQTITVLCSYCKKFISTKDGEGVSGTSHGICSSCMAQIRPVLRWEMRGSLDSHQPLRVHSADHEKS